MTWAICGPVGLFSFGIAWLAGAVATPIIWIVNDSRRNKARKESLPYTSIVNLGFITSGSTLTVYTLVPIGTAPQLKLDFQDSAKKNYRSCKIVDKINLLHKAHAQKKEFL